MKARSKILVGTLLLLTATAVGFLVANWAPDLPVGDLKARWAPPPSQFIDIAGMQVHLRDEGPRDDAMPVVLLHGTGASLHTWDGWVEALKDERRVIRFDLPAFGLTGPAPDGDYSIETYARTVVAVLDHLAVEGCVLGGNSLGGYVAWATAVLHPGRVSGLLLVDAGGIPFASQSSPIGFRIARTPGLRRLMRNVLPRSLVESSVKNVYGDPSLVTPQLVDRYFELTLRQGNRQALSERFRQTQPGSLVERLPEIDLPTLVLWGGRDRLIPPSLGQRFRQQIVGSELVIFDDLGHVPQEEAPERTVAVVEEFLNLLSEVHQE